MSPEILLIICLPILIFSGLLVWAIRRAIRFQKALEARMAVIQAAENPILLLQGFKQRWQIKPVPGGESRGQNGILAITATHIIIYDRDWKMAEGLRLPLDGLRWFGRPQKYNSGDNEIWLHFEQNGRWSILKVELPRESMQDFVRALKAVTPTELVTAYRRQRPYIHNGPETAQPATQDIHGAWTLDEPVDLYLMPRFLVIMRGGAVLRTLALEGVQDIGALRRLDQPGAQGLVRFRAEEETFAFAHARHEQFAGLLAEAAKRTLEAPLERKQKGKLEDDDYDYDYDDSDFRLEENYDA